MAPSILAELGLRQVDAHHLAVIGLRLTVAGLLGGLVAFRSWRLLMPRAQPTARDQAQAQTLIAVAGALMVAVIGDSVARAFGLVGLGAFIRFRSGIKDPRDAAVMFVMIGVGMACGLGAVPLAFCAAAFAIALLAVFDAGQSDRGRPARLGVVVDDPRAACPTLRALFPGSRVLELPAADAAGPGRIVLDVALGPKVDASAVLELLEARKVRGIRAVALEEGKPG